MLFRAAALCLSVASVLDECIAQEDKRLRGVSGPGPLPMSAQAGLQEALENPGEVIQVNLDHRRLLAIGMEEEIDGVPCPTRELLCQMDPNLGTFECNPYEPVKTNGNATHSYDECDVKSNSSGYCDDSILDVLDTLETANSAEQALDLIDPVDLERFVDLVSDGGTWDVNSDTAVDAFFPNHNANITLPERISAMVDGGNEGRRSLALCRDCDQDDGLHDFFSDKPKVCYAATSVLVESVFEVAFTSLGLEDASQVASRATWKLMMQNENEPIFAYLFNEILNGMVLGEREDIDNLAGSLAGYLFQQIGLNDMWCTMSASMTTGDLVRSACDMLLQMVALSTTNGASIIEGDVQLGNTLDWFYDSLMQWGEDCFELDDRSEEEEDNEVECAPNVLECDQSDLCFASTPECTASTNFEWVCVSNPVVCEGSNQVCDPADGICKDRCSNDIPSCNDHNKCSNSSPRCDESTNFDWICESSPVNCPGLNESCDPETGTCKKMCPSAVPSCNDGNKCTNSNPKCDESTSFEWICETAPVLCAGPGEVCDASDGVCKQTCPAQVPNCSGDRCNESTPKCDASTNFQWQCQTSPFICGDANQSCDPADGVCKNDDQLTPCIAVIDEDDDFKAGWFSRSQRRLWEDFRDEYPDRYFCLLVPNRPGEMGVPQNFLDDPKTAVHYNMPRDNGDASQAADWFRLCGLEGYTAANVQWVGIFIDDSGSLREAEVRASRDLLYSNLQSRGIQVQKVVNTQENWIKPFLTQLVP